MGSTQITFQHMNVNTISSSSGIFFGTNIHIKISSSSKSNNGMSVNGHQNHLTNNSNTINDNDGVEVTTAS